MSPSTRTDVRRPSTSAGRMMASGSRQRTSPVSALGGVEGGLDVPPAHQKPRVGPLAGGDRGGWAGAGGGGAGGGGGQRGRPPPRKEPPPPRGGAANRRTGVRMGAPPHRQ